MAVTLIFFMILYFFACGRLEILKPISKDNTPNNSKIEHSDHHVNPDDYNSNIILFHINVGGSE